MTTAARFDLEMDADEKAIVAKAAGAGPIGFEGRLPVGIELTIVVKTANMPG